MRQTPRTRSRVSVGGWVQVWQLKVFVPLANIITALSTGEGESRVLSLHVTRKVVEFVDHVLVRRIRRFMMYALSQASSSTVSPHGKIVLRSIV